MKIYLCEYSSFSKTLLYSQQESGNVISVKNFPASQLNSVEHALLNVHLPDFYDEKNNDAFQTYSRALIRDKKKRIGCSLIFGSLNAKITMKQETNFDILPFDMKCIHAGIKRIR